MTVGREEGSNGNAAAAATSDAASEAEFEQGFASFFFSRKGDNCCVEWLRKLLSLLYRRKKNANKIGNYAEQDETEEKTLYRRVSE